MSSFGSLETCCPPLLSGPLSQATADQLAAALKVLADPARLRLISLLAARPNGEACVCDLTAPLDLRQPTVSHHLKILYEAGLVDRERRGSWVYYRLLPERLRGLTQLLGEPATAVG
jgi:ArsR family transcriptional regulator